MARRSKPRKGAPRRSSGGRSGEAAWSALVAVVSQAYGIPAPLATAVWFALPYSVKQKVRASLIRQMPVVQVARLLRRLYKRGGGK